MDVSSLLGSSSASTSPTPDAFSQLSSQEFVKIMFTELSKQDPTKPTDSNALLQQMSSLRTIQSSIDLSKQLGSLVSENQFSAAATMIGRSISGIDTDNFRVTGQVASVIRTTDGPVLKLATGEFIPFTNVDTLVQPSSSGGGGSGS